MVLPAGRGRMQEPAVWLTLLPHLSFLAANSIRPRTQKSYVDCIARLLVWLRLAVMPRWAADVWDPILEEFLD